MVCVCPVVRILLIFKIFFPTRNIFCWLNCPAVLGRWWWWWKLLGHAGRSHTWRSRGRAEKCCTCCTGWCWVRTWDMRPVSLRVRINCKLYWEFRLLLSIQWNFQFYFSSKINIFPSFTCMCTQDTYYLPHAFWHQQDEMNLLYIC